jgi:hypothetical protein
MSARSRSSKIQRLNSHEPLEPAMTLRRLPRTPPERREDGCFTALLG